MRRFKKAAGWLLALCLLAALVPAEALAVGSGASEAEPAEEIVLTAEDAQGRDPADPEAAYATEDGGALPEESQAALSRGEGEPPAPDESVRDEEADATPTGAEKTAALTEIEEDCGNTYRYAEGVIEVPASVGFEISPDETTVTLYSDAIAIEAGDSFVVYLETLPIAYRALAVVREGGRTAVTVEKAAPDVFEYVDAQGVILLSEENSEFIPAGGVELLSDQGKRLELVVPLTGGAKVEVYLDNVRLQHAFSDNGSDVAIKLCGDWGADLSFAKGDSPKDVPLGEFRIYGVGIVALSMSTKAEMNVSLGYSGSFEVGFTHTSGGTTEAVHDIQAAYTVPEESSSEIQGTMEGVLKLSAGLDFLVARAVVCCEIGMRAQYLDKRGTDPQGDAYECVDFSACVFMNLGAEASICVGDKEWMGVKLEGGNLLDKSNCLWRLHWEDGSPRDQCTHNMEIPSIMQPGRIIGVPSQVLFPDSGHELQTSVALLYDMTTLGSLVISDGARLDLRDHTLTVEGNLILSDGALFLRGGTLHVTGDLLIQSAKRDAFGRLVCDDSGRPLAEGATDAFLYLDDNSTLNVDGNLVTQSTTETDGYQWETNNRFSQSAVIRLKGDFRQLAGAETNFACDGTLILCGTGTQTVHFDNPERSYFNCLRTENGSERIVFTSAIHGWEMTEDFTVNQSLELVNSFKIYWTRTLTVRGDLLLNNAFLKVEEAGKLAVSGDLLLSAGYIEATRNSGTLTVGGDFRIQHVEKGEGGTVAYGATDASLRLKDKAVLYVDGDFVTQSTKGNDDFSDNWFHRDSVIYLKGNFTQLAGAEDNFCCNGTLVLCGTGTQTVRFDKPQKSYFRCLHVENGDERIVFDSAIYGWEMTEPFTFNQDIRIVGAHKLLGQAMTVRGDFRFNGTSLDVGAGVLTVQGNLAAGSGEIRVYSGGILNVDGDFQLRRIAAVLETGDMLYTESSACLRMLGESVLNVGGDFLTQSLVGTDDFNGNWFHRDSVINLKGNFTQLAGADDNFCCNGTVVLCGSGHQTVSFATYPSSRFSTLWLTCSPGSYTFASDPCWDTIHTIGMSWLSLEREGSDWTLFGLFVCPSARRWENAEAVAAFYDAQGRMLGVWTQGGAVLENNILLKLRGTPPEGYHSVRLFLLSGGSYAPLCEAKTA